MAISTEINEALLKDIFSMYTELENELTDTIAKQAKRNSDSTTAIDKQKDLQEVMAKVEKLLNNKTSLAKSKVAKGMIDAYLHGINSAEKDAHSILSVLKDIDIPMNMQIQALAMNNLLTDAKVQVFRNVEDKYQAIQEHASAGVIAGVDTRITATQKMLNDFAGQGITSFVDKAGRNWNLASYAEMAVRTNTAHVALEAHMQRAVELGNDLVKVSRIGTTCPICAKWQGVVLSISGKSKTYQSVESARADGLFHPNCKHTMVTYDEELDGPGQSKCNGQEDIDASTKRNPLIERQRTNERNIRYWKRRTSSAISLADKATALSKLKQWQAFQAKFCKDNSLRRLPYREGNPVGHAELAHDYKFGVSELKYEAGQYKALTWKQLEGLSTAEVEDLFSQYGGILGGKSRSAMLLHIHAYEKEHFAEGKPPAGLVKPIQPTTPPVPIKPELTAKDFKNAGSNFVKVSGPYTDIEKTVLIAHTSGTGNMTRDLRNGKKEMWASRASTLASAIDKSVLTKNIILYRGGSLRDLGLDWFFEGGTRTDDEMLAALEKLKETGFIDKGFMSTATKVGSTEYFKKNAEFVIYAPAGTKALYVPDALGVNKEDEVILQKDTHFEILKIDADPKNNKFKIIMQVVPNDTIIQPKTVVPPPLPPPVKVVVPPTPQKPVLPPQPKAPPVVPTTPTQEKIVPKTWKQLEGLTDDDVRKLVTKYGGITDGKSRSSMLKFIHDYESKAKDGSLPPQTVPKVAPTVATKPAITKPVVAKSTALKELPLSHVHDVTKNFSVSQRKEYADDVESRYTRLPESVRRYVNTLLAKKKIVCAGIVDNAKVTAHYTHGARTITLDVSTMRQGDHLNAHERQKYGMESLKYETFFHEYGHAIDNAIGYPLSGRLSFINACKRDYDAYLKVYKDASSTTQLVLFSTERNISKGVQDFLNGMSGGTRTFFFGHSKEYWRANGEANITARAASEAFANITAAYTNPKELEWFKKYMPNTLAEYTQVIESTLKTLI